MPVKIGKIRKTESPLNLIIKAQDRMREGSENEREKARGEGEGKIGMRRQMKP